MKIAILGLGEAGSTFANDLVHVGVEVCGWDPQPTHQLDSRIKFAASNPDAVKGADIVFSVNLSSVSESVAEETKDHLRDGAIYCSMNTSAPDKKKAIEVILQSSGARVVDLAIMAPVPPKRIKTPMLASGSAAGELASRLNHLMDIEVLNQTVGDAAARKLLRSIVYKGVAAVVCEAMEAAEKMSLEAYMREQINSVLGDDDELIDRFISGSRVHAARRVDEMNAVVDMLQRNGNTAVMSAAARDNLQRYLE